MASLSDIRQLVADAAAGLVGDTYAYMPDSVAVGNAGALVVVVDPGDIVMERATLDRTCRYSLRARVIVRSVSDYDAQRQLDTLISMRGPSSVWARLETDGIMPGIDYCQVLRVENYGVQEEGDARYLAAELVLEILESA